MHLGRARMVATADELAPLIDAVEILVVNGDTAELHIDEWAAAARRELDALRDRCRRAGTRLVLLSGNHDPGLSPHRHLMLSGDSVFVTHGDAVDPAVAPWSDSARIIRDRRREVEASQTPEERNSLAGVFRACREAAEAEWEVHGDLGKPSTILETLCKPRRIAAITRYWVRNPRRMNAFADRFAAESRVIVVGHSHRAGIRRIGRRDVINTGTFGIPGPALGVLIDERGLHVHRIVKRNGWRLCTTVVHHDPRSTASCEELRAAIPADVA
jgi:UDP-2,3-diacylglucosamine pyrophosphatase LpxH